MSFSTGPFQCPWCEIERLRAALHDVDAALKCAINPDVHVLDAAKIARRIVNEQNAPKPESIAEHIARDIREGRFPDKSKAIARINKYEPDDR